MTIFFDMSLISLKWLFDLRHYFYISKFLTFCDATLFDKIMTSSALFDEILANYAYALFGEILEHSAWLDPINPILF